MPISAQAAGDTPLRRPTQHGLMGEYMGGKRSARGSMIRSPTVGATPKTPKDRLIYAAGMAAAAKLEYQDALVEVGADAGEWPDVGVGWRAQVRRVFIETGILDKLVVLAIFSNSITLALEDPAPGAKNPKILDALDMVFFFFYVMELAIKLVSLGFFGHSKSYFGYKRLLAPRRAATTPHPTYTIKISYWALLDTTVVVSGLLSLLLPLLLGNSSSTGPLSALRTFRLLRPLKAVSVLTDMRILMKSILQSLPRLGDMLLLFTFFLLTFGIIAVQLWKGTFRNRCYPNINLFGPSPNLHHVNIPSDEIGRVCSNATGSIRGYHCSWGATCVPESGIIGNRGKTHFDNLGASFLTLTVSVTEEGWTTIMYSAMDGTNQFAAVYFVVLTFLGAYCIINLTIVIVNHVFDYNVAYEEAKRRLAAEAQQIREPVRSFYPLGGEDPEVEMIEWPSSKDATVLSRTQRRLVNVVTSKVYEMVLFTAILGNVVCLSLWHYGMSNTMLEVLLIFNFLFSVFFAIDVALKISVFGPTEYFKVNWNLFDFTIALIGIVHVSFESPFYHSGSGSVKVLQVIRSLQVMRVLKLIDQFKRLKRWARVFLESLRAAFTLTALLALIIFIYALVGMQLFAGRFCSLPNEDQDRLNLKGIPDWAYDYSNVSTPQSPGGPCEARANFDNVFTASLSLFQILSGEDWEFIMYNGMAAIGDYAAIYFLSWYFIGNSLLLNLFVSILISRVTSIKEEDLGIQRITAEWKHHNQAERIAESRHRPSIMETVRSQSRTVYSGLTEATDKVVNVGYVKVLRERLQPLVSSLAVEGVILLAILLSCVVLVIDDPLLAPDTKLARAIGLIDIVNTSLFCGEALLKSFAYGFVFGPDTYLRRDAWNQLDFVIAVTSLLSVVFSAQLENLKILRSIRVLRPLRFINKFAGLKLVLASLWLAIPSLGMVMVLGALGWLVFAILGVQLFSGSFYACTQEEWGDLTDFYPNMSSCLAASSPVTGLPKWTSAPANFDNIMTAFLNLFEIASLEGWVTKMYLGMDSVSHTQAPRTNARPLVALYYVWFVLLGAYFVVNLFISALVDAFQEQRRLDDVTKPSLMSEDQKGWVALQHALMRHVQTPIVKSGLSGTRLWCTKLVTMKQFDYFIYSCIVLNVIVMGTEHYGEPLWWDRVSEKINLALVVVFCVEAAVKIRSYTAGAYFRSSLNKFDFFICTTSVLGILVTFVSSTSVGGMASVFRALRLLRLLRLVQAAKGVQSLVQTLFLTLPTIVNVMSVMLLVFFCFAVLGVFLFGRIEEGANLNSRATFHDFPSALLLLIRIATGESWPDLMHETAVRPPFCSTHLDGCGNLIYSYFYFTSFITIETYIILNLFIAVLLSSFDDVVANDVVDQHISAHDLDHFFHTWKAYDPLQSCLLPVEELPNFLRDLGPPLGTGSPEDSTFYIVRKYLAPMRDAEITDGMISQEGLLTHLSLLLYEKTTGMELDEKMKKDMTKRLAASYNAMKSKRQTKQAEHQYLKDDNMVVGAMAMMVQAVWRGKLARVRLRLEKRKAEEERTLALLQQTPSDSGLDRQQIVECVPTSLENENDDDDPLHFDPLDYILYHPEEKAASVSTDHRSTPSRVSSTRPQGSFRFPHSSAHARSSAWPLTPPRRRPRHYHARTNTTTSDFSDNNSLIEMHEIPTVATVVRVPPPSQALVHQGHVLTEDELNELL